MNAQLLHVVILECLEWGCSHFKTPQNKSAHLIHFHPANYDSYEIYWLKQQHGFQLVVVEYSNPHLILIQYNFVFCCGGRGAGQRMYMYLFTKDLMNFSACNYGLHSWT